MSNRSIYILQKDVTTIKRYTKNGVDYADVPRGTILVMTMTGWDFILPDKTRETVGGEPMELKQ